MKLKHTLPAITLATASFGANANQHKVEPNHLPSPPAHGFTFWYQYENGTVLDPHLPNANNPASLQQGIIQAGSRRYLH
jgi:hypothetical protein